MTRFARFSNQGAPLGDVQGVLAARRTQDVDGTDQLELTCVGELAKDDRIVMQDKRGYWHEWIVESPQQGHEQGGVLTSAICNASYNELALHPLVEVQNTDKTPTQALTKALESTRWAVGTVGVSGIKTTSAYHESSLDLIHRICEVYGCEFYPTITVSGTGVTGRAINLVAARGASIVAHRFEYRHDLVNVTRTFGSENVVTRLYGYGKGVESIDSEGNTTGGFSRKISFASVNGGIPYVEDATLLATFGIPDGNGNLQPPTGYADFPDCEDESELLALTQAELDRRKVPSVTYEADVASLAAAGTGWGGADIGDVVDIVDTAYPTPLRLEGRVLKIVEDLLGDWSTAEITLGNIVETATGASARMAAAIASMQSNAGAWTAAAALGSNYSEALIAAINAEANATGGYTYITEGQGIRTYDVAVTDPLVGAEASAVCEVKGGTMRIANTKDAGGNWEWKTVFTSGRILAELIDAIGASTGSHVETDATGVHIYSPYAAEVAEFGYSAGDIDSAMISDDPEVGVGYSVPQEATNITSIVLDDTLLTNGTDYTLSSGVVTLLSSATVTGILTDGPDVDPEDPSSVTPHALYAVYEIGGGGGLAIGASVTRPGLDVYDRAEFHYAGLVEASHGTAKTNAGYRVMRTDRGTDLFFGIGISGVNHGIWSNTLNRWLVWGDSVRVNVAPHRVSNGNVELISSKMPATKPTSAQGDKYGHGYHLLDSNGTDIGYVRGFHLTSGVKGVQLETQRTVNGTRHVNKVQLGIDQSGNPVVTISSPSAWRSALGI